MIFREHILNLIIRSHTMGLKVLPGVLIMTLSTEPFVNANGEEGREERKEGRSGGEGAREEGREVRKELKGEMKGGRQRVGGQERDDEVYGRDTG